MKQLFKATAIYSVGSILTRFAGILLLPFYTNILSPQEYGTYALLMAIYAVLNVIYQAGLLQGLTKFFYEKTNLNDTNNEVSAEAVYSNLNLVIIIGISLATLLSFLMPFTQILNLSPQLLITMFWLLFYDNLAYWGLHFLKTRQLAAKVVLFSVFTAAINISLNVLLVGKFGVFGILWAQGIANIMLFWLILPEIFIFYRMSVNIPLSIRMLKFSYPLALAGIFGILMDVADRFMIDRFIGREEVGVYSIAYRIGLIAGVIVIAFRTAYLPYILKLKHNNEELFKKELQDIFVKLSLLLSFVVIAVLFFAEDIFTLQIAGKTLIGTNFIPALAIIPYILIAYSLNGLAAFFSVAHYISGKSYHFVISDFIGLSVNIGFNLILIPAYGILGAAIATLLGFMIATLYNYFVYHFTFRLQLPVKQLILPVLMLCLAVYAYFAGISLLMSIVLFLFFLIVCYRQFRKGAV